MRFVLLESGKETLLGAIEQRLVVCGGANALGLLLHPAPSITQTIRDNLLRRRSELAKKQVPTGSVGPHTAGFKLVFVAPRFAMPLPVVACEASLAAPGAKHYGPLDALGMSHTTRPSSRSRLRLRISCTTGSSSLMYSADISQTQRNLLKSEYFLIARCDKRPLPSRPAGYD